MEEIAGLFREGRFDECVDKLMLIRYNRLELIKLYEKIFEEKVNKNITTNNIFLRLVRNFNRLSSFHMFD